ncbi:MAG TPA: hypothetical protein PKW39_05485, partial [Rectinema sp.]|nr:hypothetical protein [Rectinema sp.]
MQSHKKRSPSDIDQSLTDKNSAGLSKLSILRLFQNSESFRELGLLIFIVILSGIFQLRNPSFLSLANIKDLLANTAILSILSVGMMMVILTRGIDLSIGSTMALSGMVTALTVSANPEISPLLSLLEGM